MKMEKMSPKLKAKKVSETITWYKDVLGFEVDHAYPEEGEPSWVMLRSGEVELMYYNYDEHNPEPDPVCTGHIYFYPADVVELWDLVKDKSEVEMELQVTPYGFNEFRIKDPNGYTLAFGAHT